MMMIMIMIMTGGGGSASRRHTLRAPAQLRKEAKNTCAAPQRTTPRVSTPQQRAIFARIQGVLVCRVWNLAFGTPNCTHHAIFAPSLQTFRSERNISQIEIIVLH